MGKPYSQDLRERPIAAMEDGGAAHALAPLFRADRLTAPFVLGGPINGEWFRASVEQVPAPTLGDGDIVILDNLGSHKVAGVAEAITARGASLLQLPPDGPDLNPIKQAFAKLKAILRKAAARTVEALWQASAEALKRFTPQECRNYLASAGYLHQP